MESLPGEEEQDIPERVVGSVVHYILEEIRDGGRFYLTEEGLTIWMQIWDGSSLDGACSRFFA